MKNRAYQYMKDTWKLGVVGIPQTLTVKSVAYNTNTRGMRGSKLSGPTASVAVAAL